jgi:hypothetical protein
LSVCAQAAATLCPDRQQIKGKVWSCSPARISSGVGEAVAGLLAGQGHGPVAGGRVGQQAVLRLVGSRMLES